MSKPLQIGLVMQGGTGWMGGSEYIKNLAQAVTAAARIDGAAVALALITGHPLDEKMHGEIGIEKVVQLPPRKRGLLGRWLRAGDRAFAGAVRGSQIDFLFPLTYDNEHNVGASFPLRGLEGTRWAGWIPDFQHRHLPELFSEAEITKRDRGIAALAQDAESIVFSSEATAADYRRFCPGAKARAEVLRFCTAPVPEWLAGDPLAAQAAYHLPDRFFLISNQLWKHKNHLLVLDALGILAGRNLRPHVVCTGQPADFRDKNFVNVVLQRVHERGLGAQVAMLGLVARATQIQLMRRSVSVVQPSLCEGWSTVVEDARLLGKTVVLSDLDVHREQNPPGARFFDRTSAESLATALAEAWENESPGPDGPREARATAAARDAQLQFGRRFLEIARPR
ncbi:MAG: glycosyltransferase family 1 protein [Chthoniobacteraceae bacterium]